MQRNISDIIDQSDLPNLPEDVSALLLVRFVQRLASEFIDLRVAVAAEIVEAALILVDRDIPLCIGINYNFPEVGRGPADTGRGRCHNRS